LIRDWTLLYSTTKLVMAVLMLAVSAATVTLKEAFLAKAVTLRPVHVRDFFALRVNEILCKPRFDPDAQPAAGRKSS